MAGRGVSIANVTVVAITYVKFRFRIECDQRATFGKLTRPHELMD